MWRFFLKGKYSEGIQLIVCHEACEVWYKLETREVVGSEKLVYQVTLMAVGGVLFVCSITL